MREINIHKWCLKGKAVLESGILGKRMHHSPGEHRPLVTEGDKVEENQTHLSGTISNAGSYTHFQLLTNVPNRSFL